VDTAAFLKKGDRDGPVIIPGNAAHSRLIAAVTGANDVSLMPPVGEPLNARQITLLKTWIDDGARAPDHEEPAGEATRHWAFRALVRPAVPRVRQAGWIRNPIDAFLAHAQEHRGLQPSPPLEKNLLLRRVHLDLVGLPPTRRELHAFLADNSPNAYEKVVEGLLASPRYGERWGRHWMDVWRYSDPDGRKQHKLIWWSNPYLWRWRDWIIKSLNHDKGYDRMIVEMLAGDEAAPDDPDALAGTGFLVRNWFKQNRNVWLANTVEHTGKAFLGLTINCARCHDHKFDPISQKEYYEFRAFFEPHEVRVDELAAEAGGKPTGLARVVDQYPDRPTYVFVRGNENTPDKRTIIRPRVPAVLAGVPADIRPVEVPSWPAGSKPGKRRYSKNTGRRLALARWLTDRQNPLTARVAANHIWLRHFGKPLVDNVADFGIKSKAPLHQPLLDWLAVELMNSDAGGWGMKQFHRLIVTSNTYRMQSAVRGGTARNCAIDPDNRYYWRMNPRRLESEVVRDGLLHLAGELGFTMGGPPVDVAAGERSGRRSVYFRYSREDKMSFLTLFDAAGVDECYQRNESIVPVQALALTNGDFAWSQARRIARRLGREGKEFVNAAFEHVLCRSPTAEELQACKAYLADQANRYADPARLTAFPGNAPSPVRPAAHPALRAKEHLVHVLLNHNDFITIR
jgi:hypothetical protein